MSAPLDDLLRAYGQAEVLPSAEPSVSFTVVVRTMGTRPVSLAEALDSLAAQTFRDFDVVVVVHGPPDVADAVRASVAERLSDRLSIVTVSGGGRAHPLNVGLEHVNGSHFCFLDDDDLAYDDWLQAFADAAVAEPGVILRAVTESQDWTTAGGTEPVSPVGDVERPFPDRFDLLAHMSLNLTPICALAYPRGVIDPLRLRFCDDLPVYEDWDFLMRAAMAVGVVSIPRATSLYRRLDAGNADSAESVATWEKAHAMVIDRLSATPVLLPAGDARRLAGTHFVTGDRSRHEADLTAAQAALDQLTRSPVHWARAFAARASSAVRNRRAARRP
ncbi:MAG: glycosyltransferase [Acidimicrobiales bacterium]